MVLEMRSNNSEKVAVGSDELDESFKLRFILWSCLVFLALNKALVSNVNKVGRQLNVERLIGDVDLEECVD